MNKAVLTIPFLVALLITSSFVVPGAFAQKGSTDEQDEINGPGGLMSLTGISNHTTNSSPSEPLKIKEHHPAHVKKFIGPSTSLSGGDTPASVLTAYGFNILSCTHTTTTNWTDPNLCGHGQTIAIVDAFDDPNIANDLQTFDTQFGLPTCTVANGCFVKSAPAGITTDSGWALEISLDVQWAHSIAPGAKIILVESSDNTLGSLLGGESTAVGTGAKQVSNSWGGGEFSTESTYDSYFNSPTASFFVASGDGGHGTEWPSSSPYVISVGGTTLNLNSSGNWLSETAWSGSGGGFSTYESEPSYQKNFVSSNQRAVPDVAYDGNPSTGVYVYDSVPINGQSGWWIVGGTSAGAPQWAGISAIANSQGAKLASASFGTSIALYNAATGAQSKPQTTPYLTNYHDITTGNNGACGSLCNTILGYDEVTGLGSPQANNLILYLSQPATLTVSATPPGGTYISAQSVTLTASAPSTIFYTKDGSTPTTSSASGPSPVTGIMVNTNSTLKFFAKDSLGHVGPVGSAQYTIILPVVTQMNDTVSSSGSSGYSGRQLIAEYTSSTSSLVGKPIDTIVVKLHRTGSPTGTVQVGVFNSDLSVKQLFGTISASSITTSIYAPYTFSLPALQTYQIQSGDRIGMKFAGGNSTNYIGIMTDTTNSFDGINSHLTYYTTAWHSFTGKDLTMILKLHP